jgi:hypothetical protein
VKGGDRRRSASGASSHSGQRESKKETALAKKAVSRKKALWIAR